MMSNIREDLPENYLCPITQEVMTDPVVAADGQTYQRESITEWLTRGKRKSPLTGAMLSHTILLDNIFAKNVIREFLERRPESKEGIKPDLNLCIEEREELIKDLVIKMEDMKSHSTEVLKGKENSDMMIQYLKGENTKLKEIVFKLKQIIKDNGLSHLLNLETEIKLQQLPDRKEINIIPNVEINIIEEAKNQHQIDINTNKRVKKPKLVQNNNSQGVEVYRPFKSVQTLQGHSNFVWCLTELSNNDIASGSTDKSIKLWRRDIKGNITCIDTLLGHSSYVRCLTELSNGDITSGSSDKSIKLWSNRL